MQLLPETVLVITALVLLGAAVAVEARRGKPISSTAAIAIAALGVFGLFTQGVLHISCRQLWK